MLTEVVEPPAFTAGRAADGRRHHRMPPSPTAPPPPTSLPISAAAARAEADRIAERLATLDTAISRHIQEWVGHRTPQLVSRELDDLAERLQATAAAHLRATVRR